MTNFLVRLINSDVNRERSIEQLGSRIESFGERVEIVEVGRRAYTIRCSVRLAQEIQNKVADLAAVDRYEGLRPL